MARANPRLIEALAETAERLNRGDRYAWTHMGSCNCGHLAQTVTHLDRATIHAMALEKSGDWSEQVQQWCPTSGKRIDALIGELRDIGLDLDDLRHLERLSDPEVLRRIPVALRPLHHKDRGDVVLYLQAWRSKLEEERQKQNEPVTALV